MKFPRTAKTLVYVGGKYNAPHVSLRLDLREWSIGMRWHRSYAGMSSYLNMWTFEFSIPLFALEVVLRHGRLPGDPVR